MQCIGVVGEVLGVLENGTVIVKYESLGKKWNVNPELLIKKVKQCLATSCRTSWMKCSTVTRGVVVPECGGAPFRQIFLSRNGTPVNAVDHSWNADAAAFRQNSSFYKKLPYIPYTRNLASWFSGKSLKLLPPDVIF